MIIFKKQYENAGLHNTANRGMDEELAALIGEASSLVKRAEQGVKSERSPITLVEKVQIRDTTKLVQKLIIDITKDAAKGRDTARNTEKLRNAAAALKTSIDNIL